MSGRLLVASFVLAGLVPSVVDAQVLPQTPLLSLAVTAAVQPEVQPARSVEEQFAISSRPRPNFRPSSHFTARTMMTSLYATTATMQMLDVHSTIKALDRGGTEANPLMAGLVKNRVAFVTLKASMAAVAIWSAHKTSKTNKLRAALTLAVVNSAYALVIRNNYKIANR